MGFAGALVCVWAALGAGRRLNPAQPAAIQFLLGATALSVVFCLLGLAGAFTPAVLGGVALIAATQFRPSQVAFRIDWRTALLFAPLALVYLIWAAAPEISPDGTAYHWNLPQKYLRAGRITFEPGSIYAQFPQAMEMLYGLGLVFSNRSPALIHLCFLAALSAMVARRGGRWAALLLFATPVVGIDAASAYNDVALAAACFGVFVLAEEYRATLSRATLASAALLAGFAMSLKYTGVLALAYLAVAVRGAWPAWWLLVAAAPIAPWLLKNLWMTGNPVSPFFNAWFPNPVYDSALERPYLASLRWPATGISWASVVPEVVWRGEKLRGFLGPAFLLMPLLVWPRGRAVWPAVLFSLPFALNAGTRFLIPALPFWSLGMAAAIARWRWAAAALGLIQLLAAWPAVMDHYASANAWRIREIPWRAAVGFEAERDYLRRRLPETELLDALDRTEGRVLALSPFPEAWTRADIWVANHSRPAAEAAYPLAAAARPGLRPMTRLRYWFPVQPQAQAIRLVQVGGGPSFLAEIRLYHLLERVKAGVTVRSAGPSASGAKRAVDGRLFTRWLAAPEGGRARIELWLDRPSAVSRVELDAGPFEPVPEFVVEAWEAGANAWRRVSLPVELIRGGEEGLETGSESVKSLNQSVQYLLVNRKDCREWGCGWAMRGAGKPDTLNLYSLHRDLR